MGSKRPPLMPRAVVRDRLVQSVLALVLWWAVYWRVGTVYGQGEAIFAATCAAGGYVLVSSLATHFLNQRSAGPQCPSGPRPPPGRWPGASP